MSEQAYQAFVAAAAQDPALAEGARQALGGRRDAAASAALAAYARDRGYDVTDHDAAAAMPAAPDGALSDDQLEGVAGGNYNIRNEKSPWD